MATRVVSTFADGHSEIHRWKDGRTSRPILEGDRIFKGKDPIPNANNMDIGWLQDKTTRPKLYSLDWLVSRGFHST